VVLILIKLDKMEINELLTMFRKIRDEYGNIEIGYDRKEQLQYWRQRLVFIYASLADRTSSVSGAKILQERMKDTVRAEAYLRIEAEAKAKQGSKKSATAIKEEVGNSPEYIAWSEKYAQAYGRWQQFTDLQDSVKLTIDSISSHLRNITTSDYNDPK
jgi:hypothetical protein